MRAGLLGFTILLASHPNAWAQDKYKVTPDERAACQQDASLLCSQTYPDEDRLIACMKENMGKLSATCLQTFQAGLRKRHLS